MTVAVYFDLDGTLVTFDREYDEILESTLASAVGRVEDGWIDLVGEAFWDHFSAFADDPYRAALADLADREDLAIDPGAVADRLVENELAAADRADGAGATLDALTDSDAHRVGLLTNGVGRVQRGKLERTGLTGRFDAVLVSHEVGVHKPDPGIFETARDRIDADRYVMVGDDAANDVAPAREAGFVGIHVDEGLADHGRVRGVAELGAILDAKEG